jgi:ankyrin repeat protein
MNEDLFPLLNPPRRGDISTYIEQGDLDRLKAKIGNRRMATENLPSGHNPLTWAVIHGQLWICDYLLKKGALHSQRCSPKANSTTAIHEAVRRKQRDILQLLLSHGTNDLDVFDGDWLTPVQIATRFGYDDILLRLVDTGAKISGKNASKAFIEAVDSEKLSTMKILLDKNIANGNGFRKALVGGKTRFMPMISWAIVHDRIELATALADVKSVDKWLKDSVGRTPIEYATEYSTPKMLETLLNKAGKCPINDCAVTRYERPLIQAIVRGDVGIVKLLLSTYQRHSQAIADVVRKSFFAMELAAVLGHAKICQVLTLFGCDGAGFSLDEQRSAVFHGAIWKGYETAFAAVLPLSDVNKRTQKEDGKPNLWSLPSGLTPLALALKARQPDLAEAILDTGAIDPRNEERTEGQEMIRLAVEHGWVSVVESMLKSGFRVSVKKPLNSHSTFQEEFHADNSLRSSFISAVIEFADIGKWTIEADPTALLEIVNRGISTAESISQLLQNRNPLIRPLVDEGLVDAYTVYRAGATLLGNAVCEGDLETVSYLLESHQIDVNIQGKQDGYTPLMRAIISNRTDVAIRLCEHPHTDLDITSIQAIKTEYVGVTAFQLALMRLSSKEGVNLCKRLFTTNSVALYECSLGSTLLWATRLGSWDIVDLLLQSGQNVNCVDKIGRTALDVALDSGKIMLARELLKVPQLRLHNTARGGTTSLMRFAAASDWKGFGKLIPGELTYVNALNETGESALFTAVQYGRRNLARMLLDKPGIDIHSGNPRIKSPLHLVIGRGDNRLLEIFLRSGRISHDILTQEERNPVIYATEWTYNRALFKLIRNLDLREIKVTGGNTVLMEAVKGGYRFNISLLLHRSDINLHSRNHQGYTALDIAINKEDLKIALKLLEHGDFSDISNQNQDPDPLGALLGMAIRDRSSALEKLLECPTHDLNLKHLSKTPLFEEALLGDKVLVSRMINLGGVDWLLHDHHRILSLPDQEGHGDIADKLRERLK